MKVSARQAAQYVLMLSLAFAAGCPVTQSQDVPAPALKCVEPITGEKYWLYVPSNYSRDRDWPLVVTLHGTNPWDGYTRQIKEWKALAEDKGLIVVAPRLLSSQGILPVSRGRWYEDLQRDERVILAAMDDVSSRYRIDRQAVLLTGFSAGGYALHYVGLRNPERFSMLIARSCNSDVRMLEDQVKLTDAARRLPIMLFWGKEDPVMTDQGWAIFEYLRLHRCFETRKGEIRGGHLRRPELAYRYWLAHLPSRHRT